MDVQKQERGREGGADCDDAPSHAARETRLPIVIVTRNNLALTKLTLRSALAQDIPVEVLVVENCSSDGTAQWLRSKPGIATIFPMDQWSLAKCWNTALRALWTAGHDAALVLNNDLEIRPETARFLYGYSCNRHGNGIELNGKQDGPGFVTCVSVNAPQQYQEPALEWSYHVREHPDFSCFLIRKWVTDKAGWFDEGYFPAYCEDSDYHVRMHRAGVRAVCVDIPFLHHGASTIKSADEGEKARICRGADRNRERFRQRYGCVPGSDAYNTLFERTT